MVSNTVFFFSWWTLACMDFLGQLQQDLRRRHPAETESLRRAFLWWWSLPRWKGRAEALQWEEMPRLVTPIKRKKLATQQYNSIRKEITYPSTYPCNFIEPHEICPEQNTEDVVWRKTPAGDDAAIACPADASGTVTTETRFVRSPWTCLTVYHLPSCHLQVCSFSHNRSDPAPVHPGRCRSCLLGEPNSHQVCLQELWEHSDAGKPWKRTFIKKLNASSVGSSYGQWSQNSEYQRFRLTSRCFFL